MRGQDSGKGTCLAHGRPRFHFQHPIRCSGSYQGCSLRAEPGVPEMPCVIGTRPPPKKNQRHFHGSVYDPNWVSPTKCLGARGQPWLRSTRLPPETADQHQACVIPLLLGEEGSYLDAEGHLVSVCPRSAACFLLSKEHCPSLRFSALQRLVLAWGATSEPVAVRSGSHSGHATRATDTLTVGPFLVPAVPLVKAGNNELGRKPHGHRGQLHFH